jgi:hypothetical protein
VKLSIAFILCFLSLSGVQQKSHQLKYNNKLPRLDENGQVIDAHDGRIIQFGDRYYWYGTRYGNTNGFTKANEYVCYSSENLNQWKFEGDILQKKPEGVYYRPHVVFNPHTNKYILWYNWYPQLWKGQFGVAESNSPTGPFTIVNDDVKVRHSNQGVGDLGVFVDDDETAYLSYNTIIDHKVSVEKLNKDFTSSSLTGSEFIASHCEAGALFKRDSIYYLLTDYTCCFCNYGSGARVYTANHPLGPYHYKQNINRYPGPVVPILSDRYERDNFFEPFHASENHQVEVWLSKEETVNRIVIQQFTGNRAERCGAPDSISVHDGIEQVDFTFEYFINGIWKLLPVVSASTESSSLSIDYFRSFKPVKTDRIRIKPLYPTTSSKVNLAEIKINDKGLDHRVFKTSKNDGNPIIPAQQSCVMKLTKKQNNHYVWMGDLWGSASDNIKGHDYQFWSAPLEFYPNGLIKDLEWEDEVIIR